jgi:uncharacterized membrane protein
MLSPFRVLKYPNHRWFLLGLVIIGSVLRLYHLTYQSLWYDELHSMVPTDPQNSISSIIEYAKTDQPPLFFLYLHLFFKCFGYSEFTGRLASAIIGIIGIPVLYLLGKEIRNEATGLFAAMLTTVNYYQIYYSQDVRFYGMAFLFSALSFLFLIRIVKNAKWQDYVLYFLTTVALLYTHYYGIIIFATQALIFPVIVYYRKNTRFTITTLLTGIAVAIALIPWLPTVLQDSKIASFWIERPSFFFVARYFFDYMGKDYVSCILFLGLGAMFVKAWMKNEKSHLQVYLIISLWIILSYGLPFLKSMVGTPLLYIRYTIVTLPAWFILLAIGWESIDSHKIKRIFAAIIFVSSLLNLTWQLNYYDRIEKAQYRQASELVKRENSEALPVYSAFSWHWNFYFRNSPYKVQQLQPESLPDRFWLVQSHSDEEMEKEIGILQNKYCIDRSHKLHLANAHLFIRKQIF